MSQMTELGSNPATRDAIAFISCNYTSGKLKLGAPVHFLMQALLCDLWSFVDPLRIHAVYLILSNSELAIADTLQI